MNNSFNDRGQPQPNRPQRKNSQIGTGQPPNVMTITIGGPDAKAVNELLGQFRIERVPGHLGSRISAICHNRTAIRPDQQWQTAAT
jgi:hypothetical protein